MKTTALQPSQSKTVKVLALISKILLGLIFFVFGLNGFLHFIPMSSPPGPAADFGGALFKTGYFFPFLKGLEVLAGISLLVNRFVPLSLLVLAPIIVNIFLFHAFLAPDAMGMSVLLVVLLGFLAWTYRENYKSVLVS